MPDTANALLRELVEILGDRPYQALDKAGPFACVVCGAVTEHELLPAHERGCTWPRILEAVGFNAEERQPHYQPPQSRIGRPANEA